MKSIIISLLAFLFLLTTAQAADVVLAWDASPDSGVAAYRIYHASGATNGTFALAAIVSTGCTYTAAGLTAGYHRWYVTAITSDGAESDPSNEVVFVLKPRPPTLKAPVLKIAWNTEPQFLPFMGTLEQSLAADPFHWAPIFTWTLPLEADAAFFRVILQ